VKVDNANKSLESCVEQVYHAIEGRMPNLKLELHLYKI